MIAYVVGIAMLVPNPASLVAVAALVTGEELQVRRVEEPYLAAVHGNTYNTYASRVGRFLPSMGRIASPGV